MIQRIKNLIKMPNFLYSIYRLNFIRVIVLIVKFPIYFLKIIFKKFYKDNRNIVIVPHNGIGDVVVLIPALEYLSKKYEKVFLVIDNYRWLSIKNLFFLNENIIQIQFKPSKNYSISKRKKDFFKKKGQLFLLGEYDFDPIFLYPLSFYYKLLVPSKNSLKFLNINLNQKYLLKFQKIIKKMNKYKYYNTTTSNSATINRSKLIIENYVMFKNSLEIEIFFDNHSKIYSLNDYNSLVINIFFAINAEECVISDSVIFNILIRLKTHPNMKVYTRNPFHSHYSKLYPINFNGNVFYIKKK